MGTRCDFYVGRGLSAEWVGSVAHDGCVVDPRILAAKTEAEFRSAVAEVLASRNDATTPEQGWPWPWENSTVTDFAYQWFGGRLVGYHWGVGRFTPGVDDPYAERKPSRVKWPDMSSRINVAWGERSGVMVFGGRA